MWSNATCKERRDRGILDSSCLLPSQPSLQGYYQRGPSFPSSYYAYYAVQSCALFSAMLWNMLWNVVQYAVKCCTICCSIMSKGTHAQCGQVYPSSKKVLSHLASLELSTPARLAQWPAQPIRSPDGFKTLVLICFCSATLCNVVQYAV